MKFEDILGKAITDAAIEAFLAIIPEQAEPMLDEGREYRCSSSVSAGPAGTGRLALAS